MSLYLEGVAALVASIVTPDKKAQQAIAAQVERMGRSYARVCNVVFVPAKTSTKK